MVLCKSFRQVWKNAVNHRVCLGLHEETEGFEEAYIQEDLWLVLQDVWNNLPAEFLQKLCASVPRRIDAVLKAKGGHTKYWFDLDVSSVHSLHFINWWKN